MALAGGVAGWERPYTHTSQTTEDWRAALRGLTFFWKPQWSYSFLGAAP